MQWNIGILLFLVSVLIYLYTFDYITIYVLIGWLPTGDSDFGEGFFSFPSVCRDFFDNRDKQEEKEKSQFKFIVSKW